MNTPNTQHRIGSDVYIRDQDDKLIQFKARVFSINFETQEADIGLYPRRWGQFSELHLPDVYRVSVPLTELSLEPFSGTEQRGFEEHLIALGEQPPAWMDNAGRIHEPGCVEPTLGAVTVEAPDGTPEFALATEKPVEAVVRADTPPPEGKVEKPEKPAKPVKSDKKQPLFTRQEVLNKMNELSFQLEQLRKMLEQVL